MIDHPDFFNVRKTVFALASGPLVLLLLIVAVDFSSHQVRLRQSANQLCNKLELGGTISKLDGNDCPNGFQQGVQP